MPFNITVQDVDVTKPEGKKYFQAKVTYTYKGTNKTTNIMDFANPQVFRDIQNLKGQEVTVETGKNDKGFDIWTKVYPAGDAPVRSAAPAPQKAASTYETAEERAKRQIMIVRQSSLERATETLSPGSKGPLDPNAVIGLAKIYESYVLGVDEILEKN
jgi:hypothetical protein